MASTSHAHRIRLRFDLAPEDVKASTKQLVDEYSAAVERVVAEQAPSEGTILTPLARAEARFYREHSVVDFPQYVSEDAEVRAASSDAAKVVSDFLVETSMREDFFEAVRRFAEGDDARALTGEDARFLDRVMREFKRNGLGLPKEKKDALKGLLKRISELEIDFSKNLNEDKSAIRARACDLAGLPDDFVKGLQVAEGQDSVPEGERELVVTCKYPHAFPTLRQCSVEETRKKMEYAFSNRCRAENTKIAEEVLALRHQAAQLLGYANWAEYILEIRMAKTAGSVQAFYDELLPKLDAKADDELQVLLELKKKDTEDAFDGKINGWDFNYYSQKLLREQYGVDEEHIKHYFPTSRVVDVTLQIYQELLRLTFERVLDAPVWQKDVTCYQVSDSESGELLGFFYLDLFPRDGKYGHAAAFPLQQGALDENGERQLPVSAMVCNFPEATESTPSLLRHSDFVTFFHEFGHIMHGVLGHTKYARFSGTSTERDFVECPSQALENWCWEKEILHRVSEHHETKEKLPTELIDKMIAAKKVNAGLLNLRQVFFGQFDQAVHTAECADTEALWGKMRTEITRVQHTPDTNPTANFGHIFGGYAASYYGYLYSEVFSSDVYSKFEVEGIMNQATGLRYRNEILAKGGSDDASKYLLSFLGREPNSEAFLRHIGV